MEREIENRKESKCRRDAKWRLRQVDDQVLVSTALMGTESPLTQKRLW